MTTSAITGQKQSRRLRDWRRWARIIRRAAAGSCRRCDPYHHCGRCATSSSKRTIKLTPDPASVRLARDFVRTNLCDLGFPESADDGMLIVSELVTNAVRNAPDTPCSVTVRVTAGRPVVEVHDYSPEFPRMCEPDFVSEHGRGLQVVDELCEGWDCVPSGDGKAVIAVLPRKAAQDRPKRLGDGR